MYALLDPVTAILFYLHCTGFAELKKTLKNNTSNQSKRNQSNITK